MKKLFMKHRTILTISLAIILLFSVLPAAFAENNAENEIEIPQIGLTQVVVTRSLMAFTIRNLFIMRFQRKNISISPINLKRMKSPTRIMKSWELPSTIPSS